MTAAGGNEKLGFLPDPDAGGGGANVAASDPPNSESPEPPPNSDPPPELGVNNDGAAVATTGGGGGTEIVGIGFGAALVVATVVGIGRGVVGTVGAGLGAPVVTTAGEGDDRSGSTTGALVVGTRFLAPFALTPLLLPRASGPKFEDPKLPVLVFPAGSSPPGIPVGPIGFRGCFGSGGIFLFGPPLPGGGIGPPPPIGPPRISSLKSETKF